MYPCTLGFNKTREDRTALLFIYLRWGSLVQGNITAVSNTWVLDLLLGGAQQRGLTQGRGSGWGAPWQDSLPVQKYFLLDNLFPFICFNLSLDQASSPLIISVIPLPNPGQQICFSKVSGPEINWKKKKKRGEILYFSCGWPERWLETATNCDHFPLRPIIVHNSPWKVLKGNLDRKWSWGVTKATYEDSS